MITIPDIFGPYGGLSSFLWMIWFYCWVNWVWTKWNGR